MKTAHLPLTADGCRAAKALHERPNAEEERRPDYLFLASAQTQHEPELKLLALFAAARLKRQRHPLRLLRSYAHPQIASCTYAAQRRVKPPPARSG